MAKGTYRKKRDKVLDELEEHDPEWATQLRELRSTNPQAFRKEMLRADVVLGARLGRPTTLSMRRKRFGGDEDPVLVRRVQELRKHQQQAERTIVLPDPLWLREHGPVEPGEVDPDAAVTFSEKAAARVASGAGHGSQGALAPTPDMGEVDATRGTWVQDRTPAFDQSTVDASPLGMGLQGRSPPAVEADLGPTPGHRLQTRTPKTHADNPSGAVADGHRLRSRSSRFDADLGPAEGNRIRGRQPEDRPDLSTAEARTGPDLSFLNGAVAAIKKALATGEHDAHLDAVQAQETAGKGRKSVLAAIAARRG